MQKKTLFICGLAIAVTLTGCGKKNKSTPWDRPVTQPLFNSSVTAASTAAPDGSQILSTSYCFPDPAGPYGDVVKYTDAVGKSEGHSDSGGVDNNGYDWGMAGACVNRSMRETWAALNNQPLLVWGGVTNSSFLKKAPPAGVEIYYHVSYHVSNPFPEPNVDWQMDWYHSIHSGTELDPKQIVINYRKVNGTTFIGYWEGTIILDYISPTVTAISGLDHVNATRTDSDNSQGSVLHLINVARTGEPNWDAIPGGENGASSTAPSTPSASQAGKTAYCAPDATGKYADTVSVVPGHDATGNFDFVDGGACLERSMTDVLAAIHKDDFKIWAEADRGGTVNTETPGPGELAEYTVEYEMSNPWFFLPSNKWEMDWVETLNTGSITAPQKVTLAYQKTTGTDSIHHWDGHIVLESISPTITAITIHDEFSMDGKTAADAEAHLRLLIQKAGAAQ